MALYTISDLHLPLGIDKPMDIFGDGWENYVDRLEENWQRTITSDDVVVLPGDFSWATYLEQAKKDFEFLNRLNGRKILLKGNHDYWWETYNKMCVYIEENGYDTVCILNNNSYEYKNSVICGNRGWIYGSDISKEDKRIYDREIGRLRMSIEDGIKRNPENIYVFTHYPPLFRNNLETPFTEVLNEYGVKKCFYGHLHSYSHRGAVCGVYNKIEYELVSGDYLGFMPKKIED